MIKLLLLLFALFLSLSNCCIAETTGKDESKFNNYSCVVMDAVWTNAIRDYDHDAIFNDKYHGRQLYAWLKLKGGAKSLEFIKRYKKLPIKLEWYAYAGHHYYKDSVKEIQLTDEEIEGIENEFNNTEKGYWDFRIWDYRDLHGYWELVPKLSDGTHMIVEKTKNKCLLQIVFE